jgi:hypothetical protein
MPENLTSAQYIDIAIMYLEYSMKLGSNIYPFVITVGLIRMLFMYV